MARSIAICYGPSDLQSSTPSATRERAHPPLPTSRGRPVVFGEVLFDVFPGDEATLGGAPFNVAWHLHGLGLRPLFISRVGEDARGRRVLDEMDRWGMDLAGLQRDPAHPTGEVRVTLDQGHPSYEILPDQAYDFVDAEAAAAAVATTDVAVLYHGTLALRNAVSRTVISRLRDACDAPVFVDVNLRAPWWTRPIVDASLHAARWGKLNDEELALLTDGGGAESRAQAEAFRARYALDALILTRGAGGADVVEAAARTETRASAVRDLVDTVGAGDAFAAVAIAGLLDGWPPARILARASRFASRICARRGAIAADLELYRSVVEEWRGEDGAAE